MVNLEDDGTLVWFEVWNQDEAVLRHVVEVVDLILPAGQFL